MKLLAILGLSLTMTAAILYSFSDIRYACFWALMAIAEALAYIAGECRPILVLVKRDSDSDGVTAEVERAEQEEGVRRG